MEAKEWEVRLQFLEEAKEYLHRIEKGLLGSYSRGIDRQQIDEILRAAHSIKGGAAMMGFMPLSECAHRLEDFFKIIKASPAKIRQPALEPLFLASLDRLQYIAQQHRHQQPIGSEWLAEAVEPIFAQMQELLGELEEADEVSILAEEEGEDMRVLLFETEVESCLDRLEVALTDPQNPCLLQEFLLASQELGGLGEMLDLLAFSQLCQSIGNALETALEVYPVAQEALQALRRSQALVLVGQFHLLPTNFSDFSEEVAVPVVPKPHPIPIPVPNLREEVSDGSESTVRIPLRQLDSLGELFGELTTTRNGLSLQLGRLHDLVGLLKQRAQTLETINTKMRSAYDGILLGEHKTNGDSSAHSDDSDAFRDYFDRLELDQYGEMHLLSQEVIETIVQIQEVSDDIDIALNETESTSRELHRTTRQMQRGLTQIRMRPLSEVTDRFPRALRDMSLTYGKQVELIVRGGSTLIEQSILQGLQEPLMHMVRNSFDHGIESPEARIQANKHPIGLIEISAFIRGNQTIITLRDDGAGIDVSKVYARALKMGLTELELGKATTQELLELIFEPGFSTATTVTDLSGRGVGMDVVRTRVQAVGGTVRVETTPGKGTAFTLTLPLSLSVLRVLLVESQGSLFAVPINGVEEMILLRNHLQEATSTGPKLHWEGFRVPLLSLHNWMHYDRPVFPLDMREAPIINEAVAFLVYVGEEWVAVQADRYWGEQEVTIRAVEGKIPLPPGFAGCIILGDGRVVPLLNPEAWIAWTKRSVRPPSRSISLTTPSHSQKTIMIVDDSVNVRRFLALSLEKAGYRVEQARDGLDAIEKLQGGLTVDAVISDVEMPRLDGFGLLAKVKSSPDLHEIPVVMLTSRSGDKHRRLAMHLGANDYFAKPFKEYELMRTLEHLTTL